MQDTAGSVGIALPSHSLRLEAIPELKYDPLSEPPRGEVCLKGPIIFKGYYKAEDLTKEVLDADGWFHTGDVGEVLPSGALKIIDRKKQVSAISSSVSDALSRLGKPTGQAVHTLPDHSSRTALHFQLTSDSITSWNGRTHALLTDLNWRTLQIGCLL